MQSLPPETPSLAPGIYPDISSVDYHKLPYLGSSTLKAFRSNPATCRDDVEVTRPMILGEASHAYSLEGPDVFHAAFVIAPEFAPPASFTGKVYKATNEYKARVADFEANNVGKIVLDAEEGAAVMGLDKSLREHPATRELMNRGANELTVIWDDPATGRRCKARIDDFPGYGLGMSNDYKTTGNAGKPINLICDRNWDIQAGHYSKGLIHHGEKIDIFNFMIGQTTYPYPVTTGMIAKEWLAWALDETSRLIGLFVECEKRDYWPNFAIPCHIFSLDQIQPYDLFEEWEMPRWRK